MWVYAKQQFLQTQHCWRHFTSLCYISCCGQNCGADVTPVQLQPEELRLTHWRLRLREHFGLQHTQPAEVSSWPDPQSTCRSNCSMGISDNIWEGLIFHQKDWDCLQSAALGCFTQCNHAGKSFTASSHSLATDTKPVWVTWLQAVVWHQPVWFITCLNIKSIFFKKICCRDYSSSVTGAGGVNRGTIITNKQTNTPRI